jgi:hypothetical protein
LDLNSISAGTGEDDTGFGATNGYNCYDYNGYMEANTDSEYQDASGQGNR